MKGERERYIKHSKTIQLYFLNIMSLSVCCTPSSSTDNNETNHVHDNKHTQES